MELPVTLQLQELGWALGLGAGLGLLYDLLRPLRRGKWSIALTDGLYALLVLLALLLFALYAGRGRLWLFALAAIGASGALWLRLASPRFRRLEQAARRKELALRRRLRAWFPKRPNGIFRREKKLKKTKKLVAFDEKSARIFFRMIGIRRSKRQRGGTPCSSKRHPC